MSEKRKSISIAMAACNGEPFIEAQIDSILRQMTSKDELVISLDFSKDRTEEIIRNYMKKDKRIMLIHGPSKGVVRNFESAINMCQKEIIFLADQDDIWLLGKVNAVLKEFEDENVQVVLHDATIVDQNLDVQGKSYFKYRHCKTGIWRNILKNSYTGCCMAFRRELKDDILPIPKRVPMHDQWIGLIGELKGKVVLIDTPYILHRRHASNSSDLRHSNPSQILTWRINIIKALSRYDKDWYKKAGPFEFKIEDVKES